MQKLSAGKFHFEPPYRLTSLDHLVCASEQRRQYFEAECLGGCYIDTEVDFGGLLDRKVGGFRSAKNLVDKVGGPPVQVQEVWSIGHQTPRFDVLPKAVHGRQSQA